MDANKVHKFDDVVKLFKEEKHKFVALVDNDGRFIVPFNSPGITAAKRFSEIQTKMKNTSVKDGVYFYLYKDTLKPEAIEYRVAVAKGNVSNLPVKPADQHITVMSESVWTPQQAITVLSENAVNKILMDDYKKTIEEQRTYIKELEDELDEYDNNPENTGMGEGNFITQLTQFTEFIAPTIDEFVKLEKEKINLKKLELGLPAEEEKKSPASRTRQNGSANKTTLQEKQEMLREDGGVKFDHPKYEEYFANLVAEANDQIFSYELNALAEADEELYNQLCEKYQIEIEEGKSDE